MNHPVEEAYALRVEATEPAKDGVPVTTGPDLFGGHGFLPGA